MNRPGFVALGEGAVALGLLIGALGFQYLARIPPCEMCMWQRWPHVGAAVVGLGGPLLIQMRLLERRAAISLAALAAFLLAVSGVIGVYHAGVEWHWWRGPTACTGPAFQFTGGKLDLNQPVVLCDVAAWRLFGLSLAGYNAVISLGTAALGALFLSRPERRG
jgi:disulfide bond formation protein DsbB